jgi:hypothetical protein
MTDAGSWPGDGSFEAGAVGGSPGFAGSVEAGCAFGSPAPGVDTFAVVSAGAASGEIGPSPRRMR